MFDAVDLDEAGDYDSEELSPEELREQLAAERAARASERESNQRNERRLDEMLQGRQANPKPQALAPLGPPPNPSDDPEAFQRWMAERDARSQRELETRLERTSNEVRETVTAQSRAERLWNRFSTKYPVYAERERLVTLAYQELIGRNALPGTDEAAVDAVRREMDKMAGIPIGDAATPAHRTDDPARFARRNGGRPRKEPVDEKPVGLAEAILKKQVFHGLR